MKRSSPCVWIERNEEGRPRCEHGWAWKFGPSWRCPQKAIQTKRAYRQTPGGRDADARYKASEKGRASIQRWNQSAAAKSHKALHKLTYVGMR